MQKKQVKIELLAPAGSPEKLKYAFAYGADAVYLGIPEVSMRARINTFTPETLKEAVEYAHSLKKKVFVTLNIYAHNHHLVKVEKHLKFLKKIKVDGVIVSDPGILLLIKKHLPEVEIHLSTQANTTNWQAAKFWYELGVKRIVLAREVTLEDIKEIHTRVPKIELEYFVHGAMCMSYSGRCILSKWMSDKSANLGDCTQPCRWGYKTMKVQEVQGRHEVELEEDSHGTYFFNSKDLNLLEHLEELRKVGVMSFKIEGRNKSVYYVANVVRAYRKVLDAIEAGKTGKELKKAYLWAAQELSKLANRGYTKGFLLGKEPEHGFEGKTEGEAHQFVAEVLESDKNRLKIKAHNSLKLKDQFEAVLKEKNVKIVVKKIISESGEEVLSAHGGHAGLYDVIVDKRGIEPFSLIRKI